MALLRIFVVLINKFVMRLGNITAVPAAAGHGDAGLKELKISLNSVSIAIGDCYQESAVQDTVGLFSW